MKHKAITVSEREDVMLMQQLMSGDTSALDRLYRKHRWTIQSFVKDRLLFEATMLETADIVQDIFKRVQEKARVYRDVRPRVVPDAQDRAKHGEESEVSR